MALSALLPTRPPMTTTTFLLPVLLSTLFATALNQHFANTHSYLLTNSLGCLLLYLALRSRFGQSQWSDVSREASGQDTTNGRYRLFAPAGLLLAMVVVRGASHIRAGSLVASMVPATVYMYKRSTGQLKDESRAKVAVMLLGTYCSVGIFWPWTIGVSTFSSVMSAVVFLCAGVLFVEEGFREEGDSWARYLAGGLAVGFAGAAVCVEGLWRTVTWKDVVNVPVSAVRWGGLMFVVNRYGTLNMAFLEMIAGIGTGMFAMTDSSSKVAGLGAAVSILAFFSVNRDGSGKVRPRAKQTLAILVLVIAATFFTVKQTTHVEVQVKKSAPARVENPAEHPIRTLVNGAFKEWEEKKNRQSKTLREAVAEYKRRYHMHPPPNFDKWFEFAKANNVQLVDEFDDIYHSLLPFWSLEPAEIRRRVREVIGYEGQGILSILIRNGKIYRNFGGYDWQRNATQKMLNQVVSFLPDMDIPFNVHDEPRVLVSSEEKEIMVRRALSIEKLDFKPRNSFSGFPKSEEGDVPKTNKTRFNRFSHQPIWTHARLGCPMDTPARAMDTEVKDALDRFVTQTPIPFIKNHTAFQDVCLRPSLEHSHGVFERPNAFDVVQTLIPIFSQSKVNAFSDIIYPSPWYFWNRAPYDESRGVPWEKKQLKLYWRGSTTGGFSKLGSWRNQHRQRFIMSISPDPDINSSPYEILTRDSATKRYTLKTVSRKDLGHLMDAQFTGVGQCAEPDCKEQKALFKPSEKRADFQDSWAYKTLLDLDGNAFSGRFYAFLQSSAVVLKMNVFREWHDGWMVPWAQYIPVMNDGRETPEVMRWISENDATAKKIGEEGRRFRLQNLRNEDLVAWFARLLLEYGRIIDDKRNEIGYEF